MRRSLIAVATIAALGLAACQPQTTEQPAADTALNKAEMTDDQKHAYAMGASMGTYVNNRKVEVEKFGMTFDPQLVLQGLNDALNDNVQFSAEEMQTIARTADMKLQEMQKAEADSVAEKNIEEGKAYLAENGSKPGIVTTESGLQYEILVEGDGAQPSAEDTVTVHYRGTLLNGTEFDSSYARNEPASFPLNRVIPGWTEGVQLMKVGSKFRFHIPSELAYGTRSTGSITPNSTLIFDVELISID